MNEFKYTAKEIGEMTPFIINELCFHFRTDKGILALKPDEKTQSIAMQQVFNLSPEDMAKLNQFNNTK